MCFTAESRWSDIFCEHQVKVGSKMGGLGSRVPFWGSVAPVVRHILIHKHVKLIFVDPGYLNNRRFWVYAGKHAADQPHGVQLVTGRPVQTPCRCVAGRPAGSGCPQSGDISIKYSTNVH